MSTVLVTGFGAFGEETSNPSGALAERLDGSRAGEAQIAGRVLPVATGRVEAELAAAIASTRPDIVIATGVAPGRAAPALERVAINVRDFPVADIDGACPVDEPVVPAGPDAYLSTLPVKSVLSAWQAAGLPGYVSNTAGTYVCNQVFYLARHLTRANATRCGLVHLPVVPERAARDTVPLPSLPLDMLERAVRLAVTVTVTHAGADLTLAAGTLC
jgi:pyroglutamyl-peptidase